MASELTDPPLVLLSWPSNVNIHLAGWRADCIMQKSAQLIILHSDHVH